MLDTSTGLYYNPLYRRILLRIRLPYLIDKIIIKYNIDDEKRRIRNLIANGHTYDKVRTDLSK